MTNVKIALMTLGTAALVLAATDDASAAPPAKGATPPMSIQPTTAQRPVDTATPQAPAKSSEEPKLAPNSIYAEGLGSGIIYSINYERVVIDDLAVRAGFSYWSVSASASAGGQTSSSSVSQWTIPITVSYLGVRSRNKMLELGGGMTLFNQAETVTAGSTSASAGGLTPVGTVLVGYRLHPVEGAGFHFRVGAMAMAGKGMSLSADHDPSAFGIMPWGYLSLGGSF
jgi:hypothetical protein